MADRFNINLGLSALPDVEDPDILAAIMPLYSAARSLAAGVDNLTGTAYVEKDIYPDQTDAGSLIISNTVKIYRQFAEAVSKGNTVRLADAAGKSKAYKGTNGNVVGISLGDYAIGDWGVIILKGYVPYTGLTTGSVYCAGSTAGLISLASTLPSNQKLGRALSATSFYFSPALA